MLLYFNQAVHLATFVLSNGFWLVWLIDKWVTVMFMCCYPYVGVLPEEFGIRVAWFLDVGVKRGFSSLVGGYSLGPVLIASCKLS